MSCSEYFNCPSRYICDLENQQCICNFPMLYFGPNCQNTHIFAVLTFGLLLSLSTFVFFCHVKNLVIKLRKARKKSLNAAITTSFFCCLAEASSVSLCTSNLLRTLGRGNQLITRNFVSPLCIFFIGFFSVLSLLNISMLWLELSALSLKIQQSNVQKTRVVIFVFGFLFFVMTFLTFIFTNSMTYAYIVCVITMILISISFTLCSSKLAQRLEEGFSTTIAQPVLVKRKSDRKGCCAESHVRSSTRSNFEACEHGAKDSEILMSPIDSVSLSHKVLPDIDSNLQRQKLNSFGLNVALTKGPQPKQILHEYSSAQNGKIYTQEEQSRHPQEGLARNFENKHQRRSRDAKAARIIKFGRFISSLIIILAISTCVFNWALLKPETDFLACTCAFINLASIQIIHFSVFIYTSNCKMPNVLVNFTSLVARKRISSRIFINQEKNKRNAVIGGQSYYVSKSSPKGCFSIDESKVSN